LIPVHVKKKMPILLAERNSNYDPLLPYEKNKLANIYNYEEEVDLIVYTQLYGSMKTHKN